MRRLDFALPDFTRLAWASDAARAVWEPRVARVTRAWLEIEWRAVAAGVRACGLTMVSPQDLLASGRAWARLGLNGLPIEMQGSVSSYAATSVAMTEGRPWVYRVVVGAPHDVAAFADAWERGDQHTIGRLLGYPECCREFFRRVWVDAAMVDTTWPMAAGVPAPGADDGPTALDVAGPPEANILWRWMGVRAVPHLPCRFDCPETVRFGRALMDVGRAAGFDEEMDWLLEVLSWPVEWSALHGIAEVKTPVLRVSTRTDATAVKYAVRRQGERYPAEGARGVAFPYRMPAAPLLTARPAYRRALALPLAIEADAAPSAPEPTSEPERPAASPPARPAAPLTAAPTAAPWYAADNGFASVEAMDEAHEPIVSLAARALAEAGGGAVLDLGCGNGALLRKIGERAPGAVPFGLDAEEDRVAHARVLHEGSAARFARGDMFAADAPWADGRRYALALLMPGRLLEADAERAARLRARLAERCDRVLVYAYGDWLARAGGLRALAEAAGLEVDGDGETAALATVAAATAP